MTKIARAVHKDNSAIRENVVNFWISWVQSCALIHLNIIQTTQSAGYTYAIGNHNLERIVLKKELDSHTEQATKHQLPVSCCAKKKIDSDP